MRIGILGAGRMGRGLTELLRHGGHDVTLGSRTPGGPAFPAVTLEEAIRCAEVVFAALPHDAFVPLDELLVTIAPGTVVVDIANAVRIENGRIRSALEQPHGRWLADRLPQVRVTRAFTHVQDELLVSRALRQPGTWAVAVSADDVDALAITETLVTDTGYVPVRIGDLSRSSILDAGGPLFPRMLLPGDMRDVLDAYRHGNPQPNLRKERSIVSRCPAAPLG